MRKGIVLLLFCSLLLISCSSQGRMSSNEAKRYSSIIKEVDELIKEGQYSKAGEQIEKNNLLEKKSEGTKYNYNSLVTYLELQKLYEQKEYKKVLVIYTSNPIEDEFISKEVLKLVKGSFDGLITKKYYITAEKFYDKLSIDTKDNFKDIYLAVLNHNNNLIIKSPNSNSNVNKQSVYNFMKLKYEVITNYGENYDPDLHDPLVAKLAGEQFGISESEAGQIYIDIEMGRN